MDDLEESFDYLEETMAVDNCEEEGLKHCACWPVYTCCLCHEAPIREDDDG